MGTELNPKQIDLLKRSLSAANELYDNVGRSIEQNQDVSYQDAYSGDLSKIDLHKILNGNGIKAIRDNIDGPLKTKDKELKKLLKHYQGDVTKALNEASQIALFAENLKAGNYLKAIQATLQSIAADPDQTVGFRLERIYERSMSTDVMFDEQLKNAIDKVGAFLLSIKKTETFLIKNNGFDPDVLKKSPWFEYEKDKELSEAINFISTNFADVKLYLSEIDFKSLGDNDEDEVLKHFNFIFTVKNLSADDADSFESFIGRRKLRAEFFKDIADDPEFGHRAIQNMVNAQNAQMIEAQEDIAVLRQHAASFASVTRFINRISNDFAYFKKRGTPQNIQNMDIIQNLPNNILHADYQDLMTHPHFLNAVQDLLDHKDEINRALSNQNNNVRRFINKARLLKPYLEIARDRDDIPNDQLISQDMFDRFFKDAEFVGTVAQNGFTRALQNTKAQTLDNSNILGIYEQALIRRFEKTHHDIAPKALSDGEGLTPLEPVIQVEAEEGIDLPTGLVEKVDDFVDRNMNEKPKHNLFRSILELQDNYPNSLSLTNHIGETNSYRINVTSSNLDDAIRFKQKLQSHILNKPGILPYRRIQNSVLQDEFIPNSKPVASEVIDSSGMYYAHFKFIEGDQNIFVNFSLGLTANAENSDKAQERLSLIENLIEQNGDQKWYTKREINKSLRALVHANDWQSIESDPLDGYESKKAFPSGTELSPVHLRYEPGPNPTWRLQYNLTSETTGVKKGRGQNLHTSDIETARRRALDVLRDLNQKLLDRELIGKPSIQTERQMTDIFADLPNYVLEHSVGLSIAGRGENTAIFNLEVQRKTDLPSPEIFHHDTNNPLTLKIETNTSNADRASEFAEQVNRTFQNYLQDAYSPKDSNDLSKYVQAFRTATITNLFQKSIITHRANYPDIKIIPV